VSAATSPTAGSATAVAGPASSGRDTKDRAWRTLAIVCLACFFSEVSWTGVSVAVPVVVRELESSPSSATWLVLAPQLAATALMIGFGRLADIIGRRTVFLSGVVAFTLSSLAAGLAPSTGALIGLLVVLAVASGAIVATGAALLVDAYPAHRFGHALGIYVASFSAAALLGPATGGLIAETLGWRWLFWLATPVGLLCYLWGRRVLPRSTPARDHRLDLPGFLLLPLALLGLTFALTSAGEGEWDSPATAATMAGAAVAIVVFIAVERRASDPIVDLSAFRHPPFALAMSSSFVNAMAHYTLSLLLVLYFQAAHGESALEAGLKITPMPAVIGTVSALAGPLARFGGPRAMAFVGSGLATTGIVLLPFVVHEPYEVTLIALVVIGIGVGVFLPSNAAVVMTDASDARVTVTNAIRLTLQSLGGLLCTAVCLTVLTSSLDPEAGRHFFAGNMARLAPSALPDLYDAYDVVLVILAVLSALGTLTAAASWLYARRNRPTTD
jgi:EmrB/QacA subfamily drug resistance transporter